LLFNEPPNFLTKGALSTRNEGFFFRVGFDTLAFLALEALASFLALRRVLVLSGFGARKGFRNVELKGHTIL
jgi:hypothetical protein